MSLEIVSSDESIPTSTKTKRAQRKVNWTPSSEKETYRTVLVNRGNKHRRLASSTPAQKRREVWNRMLATARRNSNKQQLEEDDIPNLEPLYTLPEEVEPQSPQSSQSQPPVPTHRQLDQQHSRGTDADLQKKVHSETPKQKTQQQAQSVGAPKVLPLDPNEVIVISDSDSATPSTSMQVTSPRRFVRNERTKNTQTPRVQICSPVEVATTSSQATCQLNLSQNGNSNASAQASNHMAMSSNNIPSRSSFQLSKTPSDTSMQLKIKTQTTNSFKQRQLELHRHRIAVEQKRLELLEVKLARERDERLREQILFEKELALKKAQLKELRLDNDSIV